MFKAGGSWNFLCLQPVLNLCLLFAMGGFVRNKTISGPAPNPKETVHVSPEARETLRKIVEKIPRIASRSESALGFCRKPAFARRFVYRPLDVFVWWRWARQGAYAALWRRRKHFGIVPMRIEKAANIAKLPELLTRLPC